MTFFSHLLTNHLQRDAIPSVENGKNSGRKVSRDENLAKKLLGRNSDYKFLEKFLETTSRVWEMAKNPDDGFPLPRKY